MTSPQPATCTHQGCSALGRWPVLPRGKTWCDAHLDAMVAACGATALRLGEGPSELFRTRHDACGAVVDVTLPMIRRGGWTCQWCRRALNAARTAELPFTVRDSQPCSVGEQEAVLAAAGMKSLSPLGLQTWGEPLNVECLECGSAQADSVLGISEGVRLSWLPCQRCNAQRFALTTAKIAERMERAGLRLASEWTGDKSAHLQAECRRCGLSRSLSWQSLASGSPPCLRCDSVALDPTQPHRVYLIAFARLGPAGVYKVGITHSVHDRRLRDHMEAGGQLLATITVADRAGALTVERRVLTAYLPRAAADVPPAALPRGGYTECWDALAGFPDLTSVASSAGVRVLGSESVRVGPYPIPPV